jgi:DNA-binding FrmR family transcriptional regulator
MGHVSKDKKNQSRINRLIGQLESIKRMMDEGADCYRIIQQMSAAKGALNSLIQQHFEGHITEHLIEEVDQNKQEKAGKELVSMVRSYFK